MGTLWKIKKLPRIYFFMLMYVCMYVGMYVCFLQIQLKSMFVLNFLIHTTLWLLESYEFHGTTFSYSCACLVITVKLHAANIPYSCLCTHINFASFVKVTFNLLKPTGYEIHHQFNIQQLYALPTLYLCVLYLSENKQRLVPLTA